MDQSVEEFNLKSLVLAMNLIAVARSHRASCGELIHALARVQMLVIGGMPTTDERISSLSHLEAHISEQRRLLQTNANPSTPLH